MDNDELLTEMTFRQAAGEYGGERKKEGDVMLRGCSCHLPATWAGKARLTSSDSDR